jgi:folate-binding protein YgfZ
MQGYEALRQTAAWIDLAQRGKIRAAGADRARLLHAMTTNHVQQLEPGLGLYAFFLTAQGRIVADTNIFCLEDALLLDVEPEVTTKVCSHLDKFIIADDVTLEDVTAGMATVGVEGPAADETLQGLGAVIPKDDFGYTMWGSRMVARVNQTGQPGFAVFVTAEERPVLIGELEVAGVPQAAPDAVTTVRLENGKPRYGEDFSEKTLPQETGLMHALHFQKGCYIGQEIVERIRSRALLHRALAHVRLATAEAPAPGAEIHAGEQKVGEITSAAYSPAQDRVVAIAMMRLDYKKSGVEGLTLMGGVPVEVLA